MKKTFRNVFKEIRKNKRIDIIILFLGTLAIYVHNLSPSVFGVDSGDFLAAALSKGIPHASGYPLYTMFGIVFTSLPFSATAAWKFGLVSALFASLAVVFFYLTSLELTKHRYFSILSSLILAFAYPFWLYAEVVEVFSMHAFFVMILIYYAIKYLNTQKVSNLYLLSFMSGLSLTNNLSILVIFPPIYLLVLVVAKKKIFNIKLIANGLVLFVAGLTPYLYLPIAASKSPFINFGKIVNLDNFIAHVTRQTYGWGIATKVPISPEFAFKPYLIYWQYFISPLILPMALLGFFYLLITKRYKIVAFLLFVLFLSGPVLLLLASKRPAYSLTKISVLERFYLNSVITVMLFTPFAFLGFNNLIQKLLKKSLFYKPIFVIFFAAITFLPISRLIVNFTKTDLSNVFIGDQIAYDTLKSIPKDSILFLQKDNIVFPSLYLQASRNYRKDVYIPGRHDGLIQILKASGLSDKEAEEYTIKNGNTIENNVVVYKAILNLLPEKDIYSDFTFSTINLLENEKGKVIFVPFGLVFKLYYENNYNLALNEYLEEVEIITRDYGLSAFTENDYAVSNNLAYSAIQKEYSQAFINISKFIVDYYEDTQSALPYLEQAISLEPVLN